MRTCLLLFFLISTIIPAWSQDSTSLSNTTGFKLWVNGGFGIGSISSDNQRSERSYVSKAGVDASLGRYFFSYEYTSSTGGDFLGGGDPNSVKEMKGHSFMPGYSLYETLKVKIIASSGITVGTGVWRGAYHDSRSFVWGSYDESSFSYLAMPLRLSFIRCGNFGGIGLDVSASIQKHSSIAASLVLHLGQMNNHRKQ